MPKKPTLSEVHHVLRKHSALIVHFSGAPKGSGVERGHFYPQDLHHVLEGNAKGGVSCSVVCPTDQFYGTKRNAIGCIGLVLDLVEPNSLVAASSNDCGSIENNGTRIVQREVDITVSDLENSIADRQLGSHNEWVLRNFRILGVFAVPPFEISIQCKMPRPEGAPDYFPINEDVIGINQTNLDAVRLLFPELPMYTFHQGQILAAPLHSDIYST